MNTFEPNLKSRQTQVAKTTFSLEITVRHDDEPDGPQKAEDLLMQALGQVQQEYPDISDVWCKKGRTQ